MKKLLSYILIFTAVSLISLQASAWPDCYPHCEAPEPFEHDLAPGSLPNDFDNFLLLPVFFIEQLVSDTIDHSEDSEMIDIEETSHPVPQIELEEII